MINCKLEVREQASREPSFPNRILYNFGHSKVVTEDSHHMWGSRKWAKRRQIRLTTAQIFNGEKRGGDTASFCLLGVPSCSVGHNPEESGATKKHHHVQCALVGSSFVTTSPTDSARLCSRLACYSYICTLCLFLRQGSYIKLHHHGKRRKNAFDLNRVLRLNWELKC